MNTTEEGSRFAGNEDLCPCPQCGKRENIIVRWKRSPEDEMVWVGCDTCKIFEDSNDWSLSYVKWNLMVFDRNGNDGNEEMEKIYKMFYKKFTMAQDLKRMESEIDDFVTKTYMPRCKPKVGDRFEATYWYPGKWEIVKIEARYGINTGPIFILKATNLLESGRLGNKTVEFWSDRMGKAKKLDNFVPVKTWSMLVKNDECKLNGAIGKILEVDHKACMAKIQVGNAVIKIKTIKGIEVDKTRLIARLA